MLPTEEHPNEPVKVADSTHQNDCPSIREEEIAISPDGKNIQPEEDTLVSVFDRITNVIAVGLLVLVAIASIVSIVAGACMLASLSGKEFRTFPLFFASGVAPIVTGAVCLALVTFVIFFIAFCAMGIGRYGMCCYGSTKARGAMRMCLLGVFPFIVFIFLVAMGLLGFSFYSLSQQLPPLDKNYVSVPGISGPIEIVRDVNGLTHIRASNRRDAYMGQGFAEAQDRLFPLEFQRTVAQGKFAKLVGEDGVAADKIIRTLNVRDAAISMCKSTDPVHVDMLQAFADGVNLYLERVKQRPVEFFFIGSKPLTFHNPEAFSALDMCLSSRLFIWQMGSNVAFEGQRFSVWAETGRSYNEVEELYWNFTEAPNTILSQERLVSFLLAADSSLTPDTIPALLEESTKQQASSRETEAAIYDNLLSTIRSQLKEGPAASKPAKAHRTLQNEVAHVMQKNFYQPEDDTLFTYKFIDASNGWASRQADGKTMVASDPHLTVNLPPVWYYVHLSFPDEDGVQYDAAGVGLTGLPGVHVGKTTTRAHAITMSKTDLQDLFILPPALFSGLPEGTYRYAGENHKFVRRQERIEVKGKNDIVLTAQDTILGPIVTDALGFPKALMVALYAVALRHGDDTSIPALLSMSDPKVDTAEKLMGSLLGLQGPGFSIPIGDIHGNLAYAVTGRHPLRAHGHTGKYPTPAFDAAAVLAAMESATSKGEDFTATIPKIQQLIQTSNWSTYPASNNVQDSRIPPSMNPHIHIPYDTSNPTAAHISAANQKITPLGYPHLLGEDFSWPWRGARAQQMLDEKLDTLERLETHRSIQMDHRSNIWALDMRPVVNAASFQDVIADDPKAVAWAKRLLDWDMDAPIGSVEAAFFWRWMQRMAVLPRDAIKASGTSSSLWGPEHGYSVRMLTAPTARMLAECADYMGVPNSADACLQFAARTFKEQSAPGQSYNEKWGQDLNRLRGVHLMLEKKSIIPVFRRTMNKAGDFTSLDVSGHSIAGSMESTQAPSMRLLYDLWDDVDHVHFCLPGGNSGNPYSPYYQNMWDKFARQEYTTVVATTKAWGSIDRAHTQSLRK